MQSSILFLLGAAIAGTVQATTIVEEVLTQALSANNSVGIVQEYATTMQGCTHIAGNFGGGGGDPFNEIRCNDRVIAMEIRSGNKLDSIKLGYLPPDGVAVAGAHHGGDGGDFHVVQLEHALGEEIISIFGRSGAKVDQIAFNTNFGRIFGPYGGGGGNPFTVNNCRLRGIQGRSGNVIDAIGFGCKSLF